MPASVDKPPASSPSAETSKLRGNHGSLLTVSLRGPAGHLEALLNQGHADAPFVTLLCHPHPLGGGTMHNKVVYHAMKVFHGLDWPVLRFNFRGTGLSEGAHDGAAEAGDVRAGLDWLANEFHKPIVAAGFSFGAAMGLKACCESPNPGWALRGFAALGLPTHAEGRDYAYRHLAGCELPKLFLSGDHDQFAPAEQLRSVVAAAAKPATLKFIPGADHFFTGHLPAMQAELGLWLRDTFPAQSAGASEPVEADQPKPASI